jgi:hypothetical protein
MPESEREILLRFDLIIMIVQELRVLLITSSANLIEGVIFQRKIDSCVFKFQSAIKIISIVGATFKIA